MLRLTTSPSNNKDFKEALNVLSRRRKADKKVDGNPHFNAEYQIEIGTEKVKNKSNSWRIFTFTVKEDKWGANEAKDIIECISDAKERISANAIRAPKAVPAIPMKSTARITDGSGEEIEVETEIINTDVLDEDDLPFEVKS